MSPLKGWRPSNLMPIGNSSRKSCSLLLRYHEVNSFAPTHPSITMYCLTTGPETMEPVHHDWHHETVNLSSFKWFLSGIFCHRDGKLTNPAFLRPKLTLKSNYHIRLVENHKVHATGFHLYSPKPSKLGTEEKSVVTGGRVGDSRAEEKGCEGQKETFGVVKFHRCMLMS